MEKYEPIDILENKELQTMTQSTNTYQSLEFKRAMCLFLANILNTIFLKKLALILRLKALEIRDRQIFILREMDSLYNNTFGGDCNGSN